MTIRRSVLYASLITAAISLTACQDPEGLGVKREKPRSEPSLGGHTGTFYTGGFESPGGISKPVGDHGEKVAEMTPPYQRGKVEEPRGVGGAGFDNPLASDQPSGVAVQPGAATAPAFIRRDEYRDQSAYHGGFQTNRNNDNWGPSAPIQSGDQPDAPPRQPADLRARP